MTIVVDRSFDNPLRLALLRELIAFNERSGPPENWRFLGLYSLDDDGGLIGGLQGQFEWDWLHVDHLWVRQPFHGLGGQLMRQAEQIARDEGARGLFLDTMGFQARGFYEKLGFTMFGAIEGDAGPRARYFMSMTLA